MDTFETIRQIICQECDIPMDDMQMDSALMDDLDLSSFEIMTLIGALEDRFHVEIPETKFQDIVTIEDLVNVIEKQ